MVQIEKIGSERLTQREARIAAKENLMRLPTFHDIISLERMPYEAAKASFFIENMCLWTTLGLNVEGIQGIGGLVAGNIKLHSNLFEGVPSGRPALIVLPTELIKTTEGKLVVVSSDKEPICVTNYDPQYQQFQYNGSGRTVNFRILQDIEKTSKTGTGPLIYSANPRGQEITFDVGSGMEKEAGYGIIKVAGDKHAEISAVLGGLDNEELRAVYRKIDELEKMQIHRDPNAPVGFNTSSDLAIIVRQLDGPLRKICEILVAYDCWVNSIRLRNIVDSVWTAKQIAEEPNRRQEARTEEARLAALEVPVVEVRPPVVVKVEKIEPPEAQAPEIAAPVTELKVSKTDKIEVVLPTTKEQPKVIEPVDQVPNIVEIPAKVKTFIETNYVNSGSFDTARLIRELKEDKTYKLASYSDISDISEVARYMMAYLGEKVKTGKYEKGDIEAIALLAKTEGVEKSGPLMLADAVMTNTYGYKEGRNVNFKDVGVQILTEFFDVVNDNRLVGEVGQRFAEVIQDETLFCETRQRQEEQIMHGFEMTYVSSEMHSAFEPKLAAHLAVGLSFCFSILGKHEETLSALRTLSSGRNFIHMTRSVSDVLMGGLEIAAKTSLAISQPELRFLLEYAAAARLSGSFDPLRAFDRQIAPLLLERYGQESIAKNAISGLASLYPNYGQNVRFNNQARAYIEDIYRSLSNLNKPPEQPKKRRFGIF